MTHVLDADPLRRAGAAAGSSLGVAGVCAAAAIDRLEATGAAATMHHWSPYLALGSGVLATAATQQAYARGRLAWSLPALTVGNTLAATALSVAVLRERIDLGAAPFWSVGALLAVLGVALPPPSSHDARAGRGRVAHPWAALRETPRAEHTPSAAVHATPPRGRPAH